MSSPTPEHVWAQLHEFVDANSPRHKLRRQLGAVLGAGGGRVKVLLLLESVAMTHSELAEALQVDRPYATVIVNQLEALGLVERTPDPADGRRKRVALTREGTDVVARARDVIDTPPPPLLRLTPAELAKLSRLLAKLTEDQA